MELYRGNADSSPDLKDIRIKKNAQVMSILKKITQKNQAIGPGNRDSIEKQHISHLFD